MFEEGYLYFEPAHEILVLIGFSIVGHQRSYSLCCSHTQIMDVDEVSDQNLLKMSACGAYWSLVHVFDMYQNIKCFQTK